MGVGVPDVYFAVKGAISPFLVFFSPCFYQRTALKEGVTDEGLCALASAGSGETLTSLNLQGEC